jgi:hypothetical protein
MFEGWKGVVIIIGCLALIAFLVAMKVPGGGIGATGVATTLIAFVTRSPKEQKEKDASGSSGALLVFLFVGWCSLVSACSQLRNPATQAEGAYTTDQVKCASTEPTRDAADACRERARVKWKVVDGGVVEGGGQ